VKRSGAIHFGALLPATGLTTGDHFIVLYQDSGSNSVHIADLDIHSNFAFSTTAGFSGGLLHENVALSDMVQLTGVAATSMTATNVHFVA